MTENKRTNVFKVMVNPRGFMKELTPLMKRWSWLIVWLLGTVLLLTKAYAFSFGLKYSMLSVGVFSFIFGIPAGYILVYVFSFFLYWTGKIFRGKASFSQVIDAYLWTRIMQIFPLLSWIALVCLFGKYAFTPLFLSNEALSFVVMGLIGFQAFFQIWEMFILLHTLGEVQGLSAWITIWNVLFASILLLIVDGVVNWIFSSSVVLGSFKMMGSLFYR